MRAPERLNSCLTPLVIFTIMCEILQLRSDWSGPPYYYSSHLMLFIYCNYSLIFLTWQGLFQILPVFMDVLFIPEDFNEGFWKIYFT